MSKNMNKNKFAFYVSIYAIIISLLGVLASYFSLDLLIERGAATGTAWTMLMCMITILFSNITIAIVKWKKNKS